MSVFMIFGLFWLTFAFLLVILPGLVRFFQLSPDFPRGVSPPRATGRVALPEVSPPSGSKPDGDPEGRLITLDCVLRKGTQPNW